MTELPDLSQDSRPVTLRWPVEEHCRRFEAAWKAGQQPSRAMLAVAAAMLLIPCDARGADQNAPDRLRQMAEQLDRDAARFFQQHGYAEFRAKIGDYLVGSPLTMAEPHLSGDKGAPRRVLRSFIEYATAQREELRPLLDLATAYRQHWRTTRAAWEMESARPADRLLALTPQDGPLLKSLVAAMRSSGGAGTTSPAAAYHDLVSRLYESMLQWMDLEYALTIQDCQLILDAKGLLFESPDAKNWTIADSPGAFSVLVRGTDVEQIDGFYQHLSRHDEELTEDRSLRGLLLPQRRFVLDVLGRSEFAAARRTVLSVLEQGCQDTYDALYWNSTLLLYREHPQGKDYFARVCRESLRGGASRRDVLYRRLRETSFPGNTEAIWPRIKLSRFDSRILAIADRARAPTALLEMGNVQSQIHEQLRAGRLRPGGIAEFTKGRLHGMKDFLDFGVGGCEAFSSFVTSGLLSLGHHDVHPVFNSWPYQ